MFLCPHCYPSCSPGVRDVSILIILFSSGPRWRFCCAIIIGAGCVMMRMISAVLYPCPRGAMIWCLVMIMSSDPGHCSVIMDSHPLLQVFSSPLAASWLRLIDVMFYQEWGRDRNSSQPGAGIDAGVVPISTLWVTCSILSPFDLGRGSELDRGSNKPVDITPLVPCLECGRNLLFCTPS